MRNFCFVALFNACRAVGCVATHLAEYKPKPVRLLVSGVRSQLVGTPACQSCPIISPLLLLPFIFLGLSAGGVRLNRVGGSSGWIGRVCGCLHVPPGMPCAGPAVLGTAACRNSRQQASPKPSLSSPPFFEMFERENRLPTHHFLAHPRFLFRPTSYMMSILVVGRLNGWVHCLPFADFCAKQ